MRRLPDTVARQRDLLDHLLDEAEADPRWRFVELCCSLVRGNADAHSDVDVALGAADDREWSDTVDAAAALVRRLGTVVDVLQHDLGWSGPHVRMFVQYDDPVQLDLVVLPAGSRAGLPAGAVALLDRDGTLATAYEPSVLSSSAFLGWIALANVHKYLMRSSLWEALAQLDEAREAVWRLWAASQLLEYPVYGLTTVLDAPDVALPEGIERTVARLDRDEIAVAAGQLATLLNAVAGSDNPDRMAQFTAGRLHLLAKP